MSEGLAYLVEEFRICLYSVFLTAYSHFWAETATMERDGVKKGSVSHLCGGNFELSFLKKREESIRDLDSDLAKSFFVNTHARRLRETPAQSLYPDDIHPSQRTPYQTECVKGNAFDFVVSTSFAV